MLSAAPLAAGAQALPPPPYASDQNFSGGPYARQAPAAFEAMDRYGGGLHRPPAPRPINSQSASPAGPSGPYLAWTGKVQPSVANPYAAASPAPYWTAEPQAHAPQMAAPTNASTDWRPYRPQASAQQQTLPRSIYDAPPQAASAPYQQAQAAPPPNPQGGPRFYSLHRDYGIQPDAIPLPPQFFGATADLSAPSTDPLARRTTTINGQTKTVNVPDDQGAQ
jgi:hypothetical protein